MQFHAVETGFHRVRRRLAELGDQPRNLIGLERARRDEILHAGGVGEHLAGGADS